MEYSNFKYIIKSPLYIRKKHLCPKCNVQVNVINNSKIVWTDSEEAEQMKLNVSMIGGVYQNGKVKVIWKEFECPNCKQRISVEKMKEIERYPL